MGLAELAQELQGRGEESQGGKLLFLDVTNLPKLSIRLKKVREEIARLKKDEDRLKSLILAHPDSKIGHSNDSIKIGETTTPDTEDPHLHAVLRKKGHWDKVATVSISKPKLREVAEEDEDVAKAITWLSSRTVRKR